MQYPNLTKSNLISFDIETYDPLLSEKGTGAYRKDGFILCVAIIADTFKCVYPIDHPIDKGGIGKEEKEKNIKYLKEVLGSNTPKIGTNIMYDIDWLQNGYGIKVNGELNDIQMAEPLICEYRDSFSLDNLAKHYLNLSKAKSEIELFCEKRGWKGDARRYLKEMPFDLVARYAVVDSDLPIKIFEKQKIILEEENLMDVYKMEISLLPLLLQMRKTGVRINSKKVDEKAEYLENEIKKIQKELNELAGKEINVKSPIDKKLLMDKLNIAYKYKAPTEKMLAKGKEQGNPILDKKFLSSVDNPIAQKITLISHYRSLLSTFFIGSFKEMNVNDRIHCNFNSLKKDNCGTISGRFSSSNPNLQNLPKKGDIMKGFCREIFIPEEACDWGKFDYSQIEYRIFAHYAEGEGADKMRDQYKDDPDTDYHKYVMGLTGLQRDSAKTINFGLLYFMGIKALAANLKVSEEEAKQLNDNYFKHIPCVKDTRNKVVKTAKARGYLRTIMNRRARVSPQMIRDKREYSMFNRLIQGSAADIMKKGMLDAYTAGIFDTLFPHITVHDELDFSIPRTKEGKDAVKELKQCFENCIKLRVPIRVDFEIGDNWGNLSEEKGKEFLK